jgi:hypothetical protein
MRLLRHLPNLRVQQWSGEDNPRIDSGVDDMVPLDAEDNGVGTAVEKTGNGSNNLDLPNLVYL